MKSDRRFITSLIEIILGIIFNICYFSGLTDAYFSGLGFGLLAAGVLQLIRYFRYRSDKNYREKTDIDQHDERNRYLALKAWAFSAYLFVIIGAVASICFRIAGLTVYSQATAYSICAVLILYVICYFVFKRKY